MYQRSGSPVPSGGGRLRAVLTWPGVFALPLSGGLPVSHGRGEWEPGSGGPLATGLLRRFFGNSSRLWGHRRLHRRRPPTSAPTTKTPIFVAAGYGQRGLLHSMVAAQAIMPNPGPAPRYSIYSGQRGERPLRKSQPPGRGGMPMACSGCMPPDAPTWAASWCTARGPKAGNAPAMGPGTTTSAGC